MPALQCVYLICLLAASYTVGPHFVNNSLQLSLGFLFFASASACTSTPAPFCNSTSACTSGKTLAWMAKCISCSSAFNWIARKWSCCHARSPSPFLSFLFLSLSLSISLLTSAGVSQAVTAGDRKILRTGQRQMKYDFRWHNLLMLESAAVRMGRAVRTRGGQGYVVS